MAGLAAGVLTTRTNAAPQPASAAVTKVKVVATEFKFALSKRSVPVGKVAFTVVNKGKISHNFRIAGKTSKTLNPGQSQTLTVTLKKGKVPYDCTLLGHAKVGMKGVLAVGVKAVPVTPTPTTTPPPTTTAPPKPTGPVGTATTTVQVGMFEYRFDMSQSTIPSGQVTFVVTNKGQEVHNFSINGVKEGKMLSPGQTETYTVALPAGSYGTVCDVPFHADRGMTGQITVTS
jgi:plastocyanin